MLVLKRRAGEQVRVGDNIIVKVLKIEYNKSVTIGFEAPKEVTILREEVALRNEQEKQDE